MVSYPVSGLRILLGFLKWCGCKGECSGSFADLRASSEKCSLNISLFLKTPRSFIHIAESEKDEKYKHKNHKTIKKRQIFGINKGARLRPELDGRYEFIIYVLVGLIHVSSSDCMPIYDNILHF